MAEALLVVCRSYVISIDMDCEKLLIVSHNYKDSMIDFVRSSSIKGALSICILHEVRRLLKRSTEFWIVVPTINIRSIDHMKS